MATFAPKFCPKHLTIHICDEMDVSKQLSNIEGNLGAKIRKLHGTQTEEERRKEALKQQDAPGTFGAIIAQAKANAEKQKAELNNLSGNDDKGKVVTEDEVSNRMEALRAKVFGGSTTPSDKQENDSPIGSTNVRGLGDVIQKARDHQVVNPHASFKVPKRSKIGEKIDKTSKESSTSTLSDALNESDLNLNNIDSIKSESKVIKKTSKIFEIIKPLIENKEVFTAKETENLLKVAIQEVLKYVNGDKTKTNKSSTKNTTTTKTNVIDKPIKKTTTPKVVKRITTTATRPIKKTTAPKSKVVKKTVTKSTTTAEIVKETTGTNK